MRDRQEIIIPTTYLEIIRNNVYIMCSYVVGSELTYIIITTRI